MRFAAPTDPTPGFFRPLRITLAATAAGLALASCSVIGGGGEDDSGSDAAASGSPESAGGKVVLVTHGSFNLGEDLIADFERETGYELVVQAAGDGGTLTNKLALTAGDPPGDVALGVDNTFASRALEEGVFAEYTPAQRPDGVAAYDLPGDDGSHLTPVDTGNVCVNLDTAWFTDQGLPRPSTLDDLTDPAYRDLFVTPGAATSSPGMAFLLATIAEYGEDGWQDYWTDLLDNGAKLVDGWEDAYYTDFTQGGGNGQRPIVLSYDSSPAFTIGKDGSSTTEALLDTCFAQVEYAGVLDGAENEEGARALVDFLLTDEVQAALPDLMYVYPVSDTVDLPKAWAEHAPRAEDPHTLDPAEIEDNRETWLREWSDLTTR
ncbi:thiamine ABC transporter substrate-binding protein [Nocardioides insulae]|uniref:thiamine ABC transporter substrate-binding protein n=1 Tax=Nocardioides insulae TaxID=394734 RepID=UPI0004229A4A|nr:thiamine ABC transporter substrate-binding protein [Nocardioides insulae]